MSENFLDFVCYLVDDSILGWPGYTKSVVPIDEVYKDVLQNEFYM
jgi:hypothetical protein